MSSGYAVRSNVYVWLSENRFLVQGADPEAAVGLRFLGSPTVRVDGVDVEPGAEERRDYALACRIYRSEGGVAEQPQERWIREALIQDAT